MKPYGWRMGANEIGEKGKAPAVFRVVEKARARRGFDTRSLLALVDTEEVPRNMHGDCETCSGLGRVAYEEYARRFGNSQSLERLAERGGFGVCELSALFPGWRIEYGRIKGNETLAEMEQRTVEAGEFLDKLNRELDGADS